ncbi:MAG: hypothetical protein ACREOY_10195 [Candidatus Dormibacteraceae bacterium]
MTAREDPSGAGRHSRPRSPVYEVGSSGVFHSSGCLLSLDHRDGKITFEQEVEEKYPK